LPNGLSLNTTSGVISGTAGNSGSASFTIRATDTDGDVKDQAYSWTITNVAPTSTGGTVTISAVNEGSSASYDVDTNFTFTTGSTFSAYSLASGSLPSGLSLNASTGVISGTMGTVSSDTAYSFTIRGTDTNSDYVDQAYSWTITEPFTATGGTITNISGYRIHTFTSSASGASGFVPNKSGTVDILVVAGGGAGGGMSSGGSYHGSGGGAGAGGMQSTTTSVTATSYSITVGAGGAGSSGGTGGNGTNSSGLGLTSIGGGHGARGNSGVAAASGGSGGGASRESQTPANGTSGQGNAGGAFNPGASSSGSNASGGGGKGAVGGPYNGGAGASWNGVTYAGGGGGGEGGNTPSNTGSSGGSGGGGNGGRLNFGAGGNGSANLGGGGGGGGAGNHGASTSAGGNGGSGIVIIRYAI
jgi:hypothetical protein